MKDNTSREMDGIPSKVLMETVEQIRIPLEWKDVKIIPLFKKGSRYK